MNFIGRHSELMRIQNELAASNMRVVLIYGRRRVGKSELIKQALNLNTHQSMYYECRQVAQLSNVSALSDIISEVLKLPKLGFQSIEEVLDYVFQYAIKEELILVLDEYPYLKESIHGMDSILQALIDKYHDTSKLKLVVLGSYVDIMKSMLEHSNPLFGRIDLTINLKQMDYYDSSQFYPNYSNEDKVRIFSVFGGIPYYNRLIDDSKSVKENILNLIVSPGARLENEISSYLNAEISKMTNANEVFESLAMGFSKYGDILSQSHVSSSPALVDTLNKLIRMEVVEKRIPINDEKSRKKAGYFISDNLTRFFYRYIFKYSSQRNIMAPEVFFDRYIFQDFEELYVPKSFENLCRQYLIRQNRAGKINPVLEKIGKYYYDDPIAQKNGEFDIVSQDENGYIFYEVKFRKNPLSENTIHKEIAQVNATGLECYEYVFFSRSKVNIKAIENVRIISLDQLFTE